jgi:hypothetical protein
LTDYVVYGVQWIVIVVVANKEHLEEYPTHSNIVHKTS